MRIARCCEFDIEKFRCCHENNVKEALWFTREMRKQQLRRVEAPLEGPMKWPKI